MEMNKIRDYSAGENSKGDSPPTELLISCRLVGTEMRKYIYSVLVLYLPTLVVDIILYLNYRIVCWTETLNMVQYVSTKPFINHLAL